MDQREQPDQTAQHVAGHADVGLPAGSRYRCEACGNLTRFDVRVTERARRFWHAELSGEGRIESVADRDLVVDEVQCRWCGHGRGVVVEPVPGLDPH